MSAQEKRALLAKLLQEKAHQKKTVHPLSYGQQALWFLYQTAPDSAAYNTAFTTRLCSPVDLPNLQAAFQTLINRHPALRSTFRLEKGEPVQEVQGFQTLCFEQVDVSTDEALLKRIIESYQRPFQLETGPVMRVT